MGRQDAGLSRHLAGSRHGLSSNIEGHPAEKGIAAARSIIVDPPDGKIPYKPRGPCAATRELRERGRLPIRPSSAIRPVFPARPIFRLRCRFFRARATLRLSTRTITPFAFFIPIRRPHFDNTDWWMGDTRYRWEGDTLVADVVALTDQLWLDQAGNFHSTEIHIVERYRMTGADTIEYEARIEDPVVYSRPGRSGPFCTASRNREPGSSRTNASRTPMACGIIFPRTIRGTC